MFDRVIHRFQADALGGGGARDRVGHIRDVAGHDGRAVGGEDMRVAGVNNANEFTRGAPMTSATVLLPEIEVPNSPLSKSAIHAE